MMLLKWMTVSYIVMINLAKMLRNDKKESPNILDTKITKAIYERDREDSTLTNEVKRLKKSFSFYLNRF